MNISESSASDSDREVRLLNDYKMKRTPIYINGLLILFHMIIVLYFIFNKTSGEAAFQVKQFYHNYTLVFIIILTINSLIGVFISKLRSAKIIVVLMGLLGCLVYIGFYNLFNPW